MYWKENDQPCWEQVYGNIFLRFLKFSPMQLSFEHDIIVLVGAFIHLQHYSYF